MDEQLKNGLLSLAIDVYSIGYLLLTPQLVIQTGNRQVAHWLELPLDEYVGREVTEAFAELIGSHDAISNLTPNSEPYRLEYIFRASGDGRNQYFDLQIQRLEGENNEFLLTTVDVTQKARQEQILQQQRNEVQLLSAELTYTNERLSYILSRLVPSSVAQSVLSDRKIPQPGAETARDATILFADMREFTAYAEVYQPADTLEFLNTYLAVVSEAILRHEGSLVQLVGDMVMGVFNLPVEQPDHALRGVRAALDIQESLRAFNVDADSRFPTASFGVGISTGPVISGYLGFQRRFRYAVVGDATNVAFHLSSLAAAGHILLSETTMTAVGDAYTFVEMGNFQLKRRRKTVRVYELSNSREAKQLIARPAA